MPKLPKAANPVTALTEKLRRFAKERDWEQFHSPKNLASALIVEAAEILEHFQWMTEADSRSLSPQNLEGLRDEIGDVFIYLLRLADVTGIDIIEAANLKIEKNCQKYPAEKVRGKSLKYSEYGN